MGASMWASVISGGGVGFLQIKIIRVECEMDRIKNHFAGAGYSTKRGVINLQFDNDAPPPPDMTEANTDAHILGVIFVQQYGLNKGIELFGEKSDAAVVKELTQINELETYEPIMAPDLSWEEKKKALESLLFITEKRNGDVNPRKVADSRKQCMYDSYDKADRPSPNVTTESILFTVVVDAREGREVSVLDVANAFLHAHNDERVLVLIRAKLAEMMARIDPSMYQEYVMYYKNGVPMMYVRLSKALYGMLRDALLFYKRSYMIHEIGRAS